MPTLPSGLKLGLMINHIMEPDRNWFRAPEGHFWYWQPVPEISPPFVPGQELRSRPATAPVPTSRETVAKHIRVGIGREGGRFYWRGETLSEFPQYGSLSEEDAIKWQKWLEIESIQEFMDSVINKCQIQAEINKDATGYAMVTDAIKNDRGSVVGNKVIDDPTKGSH